MWEISWSSVFSKCMLSSKLSLLLSLPRSLSLSLLLMYLPTDRIQQILSCARCAALRQPTVPTGQNSCSEGLHTLGFPPFFPDRPPWQARAGLRLLYVFTSHRLPLLGERYSLSSSVRVSKCWIVLAKALSGRNKWTGRLGPRMSWRSKQHLPFVKVINFRQIVFEILGAV